MTAPKRIYIIIGVAAVVLAGLYIVNPSTATFAPKCPMRLLTGLSCPACGIQRFLHAIMHGNFGEAIAYNYYLAYSLPYALLFVVEWAMPAGRSRSRLARVIENRYVVGFYVVTFLVWMIVRNILGI